MLIKALIIAFSTYSRIPMPQIGWDAKALRFSLCFLPVVGLIVGLAMFLWHMLCGWIGAGAILFSAGAVALPVLLTGGIHMDGFCDTIDALASHQSRERKLEILKDPHAGAFAIVYCCVYLLLCFGFWTQIYGDNAAVSVACAGFVVSRAIAGHSAAKFPRARKKGMLASVAENAPALPLLFAAILALIIMLVLHWLAALAGGIFCALGYFYYYKMTCREFGGVTGDTTGFFIQLLEILLLLGVICGYFCYGMA